MGSLIETLHTGSLIIDDIEDQSKSRRENPCAHLVYGVKKSINSANLMYFLPFKKILESNFSEKEKAKLIEIYAK
jgi:octaprenyl-diphosphate synthase